LPKGVKVQRLHNLPTILFARRDAKSEPWPQSCWIMNNRTRKPAAGTASAIAGLQGPGTSLHDALDVVLRVVAVGVVVAAGVAMTVRHQFVRLGLAEPLSMKAGSR